MVNEIILEGIKSALSKGESLASVMQSFYNAGYTKEEIEEAARMMQMQNFERTTQPSTIQQKSTTPQKVTQQNFQKPGMKQTVTQSSNQQLQTKQIVSNYDAPKKKSNLGLILLIILLIFLIAGLVLSFVFKDQLLDFISNLF